MSGTALARLCSSYFSYLITCTSIQGQAREGAVRHYPCTLHQPSRVVFYAGILQNSVGDPELFIPDPDRTSDSFRDLDPDHI
jgi:Neuraminidase (sialidase)